MAIQANGQVRYYYDELGRLIQVVAPDGQSAQYAYDAVGNILSINRLGTATVSISEFTPNAGPVGTTVTIYGTGFNANPADNVVQFNGTAATVSAASATQLTVSVPSGASTGKITVIVGGNTATSTQDFTVFAAALAPTITGFTPSVAAAGTTVTVSGTNFDTNVANDKVAFNGTLSFPTSATAVQLGTKVPGQATSGKIRVATPYGSAISASDFFVIPAGYAAADLAFTGRTTIGAPAVALNLAPAGKVGMLLFDGVKGQQLALGITNVAFSPSGGSATVFIKKPNGGDLIAAFQFQSQGAGVSLPILPATGTYTILIVPNSAYSVSASVSVSEDVTGSMVPGGTALTVATTFPGQAIRVAFDGIQGQRISLRISGITFTGGISLSLSILKPDGSTLANVGFVNSGGKFIDVQTLPVTGKYSIVVDPAGTSTVNATLTLYNVVDTAGTIVAGGAPVTVFVTTPGQSANLTSPGTQGQRFAVGISAVSLTGGSPNSATVFLLNADGTTLASLANANSNSFIEPQLLPASGTYTVGFHPINGSTGAATLTLYDVPADATGTITAGGAPVVVANTVAGQNANLTFNGTAGQRVSLAFSNLVLTGQTPAYLNSASFSILKPDATTLASVGSSASYPFIDTQTLPVSGTYAIRFDPSSKSVGTATLALYDVPPNPTSSVEVGGTSTTVSITVPGQNANVSFSGVAGQQVTVRATRTFGGHVVVSLLKPDNSTLTWTQTYATSFNLATQTLPTTGTYNISINPSGGATGDLTISVTSP